MATQLRHLGGSKEKRAILVFLMHHGRSSQLYISPTPQFYISPAIKEGHQREAGSHGDEVVREDAEGTSLHLNDQVYEGDDGGHNQLCDAARRNEDGHTNQQEATQHLHELPPDVVACEALESQSM